MCGGSLVTTKYVVSAAHCEYSSPNRLTVTVGDVTLMATESTEQFSELFVKFLTKITAQATKNTTSC